MQKLKDNIKNSNETRYIKNIDQEYNKLKNKKGADYE